ncbi:hypothetical protein DEO72_LG1g2378 [Vigna unguiculata]|uniref:Uncharacterized protein n=1 Tax=Vigna unguiculata TaxID=3917 RepID=A0A4D6KMI5_VIGUN|nr:hypothetical protein DEO72_LG1g2378 [Vigna unguiculata]
MHPRQEKEKEWLHCNYVSPTWQGHYAGRYLSGRRTGQACLGCRVSQVRLGHWVGQACQVNGLVGSLGLPDTSRSLSSPDTSSPPDPYVSLGHPDPSGSSSLLNPFGSSGLLDPFVLSGRSNMCGMSGQPSMSRALLGLAVNSLQANYDSSTPSTYFTPRVAALLRSVSRMRRDILLAYFLARLAKNQPQLALELSLKRRVLVLSEVLSCSSERRLPKRARVGV